MVGTSKLLPHIHGNGDNPFLGVSSIFVKHQFLDFIWDYLLIEEVKYTTES